MDNPVHDMTRSSYPEVYIQSQSAAKEKELYSCMKTAPTGRRKSVSFLDETRQRQGKSPPTNMRSARRLYRENPNLISVHPSIVSLSQSDTQPKIHARIESSYLYTKAESINYKARTGSRSGNIGKSAGHNLGTPACNQYHFSNPYRCQVTINDLCVLTLEDSQWESRESLSIRFPSDSSISISIVSTSSLGILSGGSPRT